MKIIGEAGPGHYVAIVSHDELEKVFNKFYSQLPPIKVGEHVELSMGYNYRGEIKNVCQSMQDSMKAFERARATLQQFAVMVAEQVPAEGEQK
jgi:hypothetical protein